MRADDSSSDPLQDVLTAGDARWQRHVGTLDWQPDYRIRGPEDPFTPAQEYLHHAHWLEYASSHLSAYLDGRDRPARIEDVEVQNNAWAAEDAAVPHDEAKARAAAPGTGTSTSYGESGARTTALSAVLRGTSCSTLTSTSATWWTGCSRTSRRDGSA